MILGLIIGILIGGVVGVFFMALCVAGKNNGGDDDV